LGITRMNTPDTREEFERRMNIMHYSVMNGKLLFCEGLTTIEGISDLHAMPNGRVDLLTVNEAARLQANMMVQFGDNILDIEEYQKE
jgi:hypothetical protein